MEQAKSVHLCLQGSKRKGSLQKSLHSLQSKRSGFSSSKLRLTEGALPETGRRPGIAACSQSTHSEVSDAPWVCSEGESQLAVTCSGRSGCGAGSRPKGRWNELLRSARLCIAANAAVPSVPCSPSLGYCGNLVLFRRCSESFCPPHGSKGGGDVGLGCERLDLLLVRALLRCAHPGVMRCTRGVQVPVRQFPSQTTLPPVQCRQAGRAHPPENCEPGVHRTYICPSRDSPRRPCY